MAQALIVIDIQEGLVKLTLTMQKTLSQILKQSFNISEIKI